MGFIPAAANEYERRRTERAATALLQVGRERLLGRARIVAFLAIVALVFLLPLSEPTTYLWFAVPVIAFLALLAWHRQVLQSLTRARRAEHYFLRGLDRLNDRWVGRGPAGERYDDPKHPCSADLDLFGRGSLFQYLCEAHTPRGQDTLAAWLLSAAGADEVRARQAAVAELRGKLDLREALGTLGDPDHPELKTRELLTWPAELPVLSGRFGPIVAVVLSVLGLMGVVLWAGFGTGPSPLLFVIVLEVVFVATHWGQIRQVTKDSSAVLNELMALLPVLRLLESQQFECPLLISIRDELRSEGGGPSQRVARLAKLLDAWDSAIRNQFVLPFAIVLMVPMHLVCAIERWRLRDGRQVRNWLDAVGQFEALCSLATFAYEHPEYTMPDIAHDSPIFDAVELGHPLIPASRRVANDVAIGLKTSLLLVSGSNMSGKSTLMRAVGVNVVLALAGAPACAHSMRVSRLAVATSMRQGDSLQDGLSSFSAEIHRLQAIREMTRGSSPVLFLLDEILRGTNSHDRRAGAQAVIEALLAGGAIGLVSTHDLALAEIVDRLGTRGANVHFEDQIADSKVSFDYRLRPGVVPRGNGLVLLRLLGFEVNDQ